jgi:NAD(P)-dependent dehydrogenase (short-subunit alcohol dehydrogenase family)
MGGMGELSGAVLITGAAKRLGAAMARAVARDGFDVAIHCHRSLAEAESLAGEIEALGRRVIVTRADLGREVEAAQLVPDVVRQLGPLAVLVNNASVFELDRLASADRASWDRHVEANLRAPIVLSQGFVAQLPADRHGLIVNLLDQRILNLTPNYLSYSVSKMGLWGATQVLARELAPRVRVNAIGPGPALPSPGVDRARFEELCRATPLQRGPDPEEIAGALRFIMASPSMTGQMITLDGGQQLGWLTPRAPQLD